MAALWHNTLMSLSGFLILSGIFLTWLVRRKIEGISGQGDRSSVFLLVGGLITALGFAWAVLTGGEPSGWMLFLILLGPAIIGYALSKFGFSGVSGRLMIQTGLMLLSLFGAGHYSTVAVDIAYIGPFLAVLLLMNAQIIVTDGIRRTLIITASWLIVLFSWTRYLVDDVNGPAKALIVAPYTLATVIWVATLVSLYLSVSADHLPLPRTGQEGL